MLVQQNCSLIYKDGLTFLLFIYPDHIDPNLIPQDPAQGDNNPIDTTNRIKAYLENDGWTQTTAGRGEINPNHHYWHFSRMQLTNY
jgi:hypothetical protein